MNRKTVQAYAMLIASMLIFGTIGIFRRYIPLSSALLACVRGLMGASVLCIYLKIKGEKIRHGIGRRKTVLLAVSGALMGANWIFLFEAYNHTTVAVATLCYYMQPTIVILLSPLLFNEKITPKKVICVAVSLIGMVLVSGILSGDGFLQSDITGIALGLAAAALYASVVIFNKKIPVEDTYEKTVIQLVSAAFALIPYLLLMEDFCSIELTPFSVLMVLIVGIVHTGVAYALYFGSMNHLKAQSIAVLSYIDPVSALILSAIFLHESLSVSGVIGAVMIIGSALFSELEPSLRSNARSSDSAGTE